jgi:hypothetical protein
MLPPSFKAKGGGTTQKTTIDIFTAVRTSNLIHLVVCPSVSRLLRDMNIRTI